MNTHLLARMRARRRGLKVHYYYDAGGKPRKEIPLGSDYNEAVRKWSELHGRAPAIPNTVAWLIGQYQVSDDFKSVRAATQKEYGYALDKIREYFGTAPIAEVTTAHVRMYVEMRTAGTEKLKASRHRALREKNIIAMLYNWAGSFGYATHNPAGVFRPLRYKRLPGRKHIDISDDMLQAVYERGTVALQDAMDLAYYIGQRPADTLNVRETDIIDWHVCIEQGKTGTPLRIPVIDGLADLVARVRERKAGCKVRNLSQIFLVDERGLPMTKAKLRARFEDAREAAGIDGKDFQFRDLRRKAGTDLREQAGKGAAQELLGHKGSDMTEHYTGARGVKVAAIPRKGSR